MGTAEIAEILAKPELQDQTMSLGFRRFFVLSDRVKLNLMTAHLIQTGSSNYHDRVVEFFNEMTESEYLDWLKFN